MKGNRGARAVAVAAILAACALLGTFARAADAELSLPPPGFDVLSAHSDPSRLTRRFGEPYRGEIVDVLTHVTPPQSGGKSKGKNPNAALDQISEAGVAGAILEATPNEGLNLDRVDGTSYVVQLARRSGGRVRAFCGTDYLNNWLAAIQGSGYGERDIKPRLDRLDKDLGSGNCVGLGEFALLHFNKEGFQNVIQLRPTFPPLLAVIDVVARRGAWLQLHSEPVEPNGTSHEKEVFGALALFYRLHPDLKIILSHTAMTNATNARRLLTAYPRTMMSIKLPRNDNWSHLEPIVDRRGELYEDWARLMEDMPDRFMVGSDAKFAANRHGSGDKYPKTIALFRKILGSLSPNAASAIAGGNARRLLLR